MVLTTETRKSELDSNSNSELVSPLIVAMNINNEMILKGTVETNKVIAERGSTQDPAGDSNKGEPVTDFPGSIAVMRGTQDTIVTPEPRENKRWEILKGLVYGGLVESITSLGIVTSAASADVATANIVALALANLIGGIFVIGHNMIANGAEE